MTHSRLPGYADSSVTAAEARETLGPEALKLEVYQPDHDAEDYRYQDDAALHARETGQLDMLRQLEQETEQDIVAAQAMAAATVAQLRQRHRDAQSQRRGQLLQLQRQSEAKFRAALRRRGGLVGVQVPSATQKERRVWMEKDEKLHLSVPDATATLQRQGIRGAAEEEEEDSMDSCSVESEIEEMGDDYEGKGAEDSDTYSERGSDVDLLGPRSKAAADTADKDRKARRDENRPLRRRYRVEAIEAPQIMRLRLVSLRCPRTKLPAGNYVLKTTLLSQLGGNVLTFENLPEGPFGGASSVVEYEGDNTNNPALSFNEDVFTPIPASAFISPFNCYLLELYRLRDVSANHPVDTVVGWGYLPAVSVAIKPLEGEYKVPLLRGDTDRSVHRYAQIQTLLSSNIDVWLGNLYLEVSRTPRFRYGEHEFRVDLPVPPIVVHTAASRSVDALKEETVALSKRLQQVEEMEAVNRLPVDVFEGAEWSRTEWDGQPALSSKSRRVDAAEYARRLARKQAKKQQRVIARIQKTRGVVRKLLVYMHEAGQRREAKRSKYNTESERGVVHNVLIHRDVGVDGEGVAEMAALLEGTTSTARGGQTLRELMKEDSHSAGDFDSSTMESSNIDSDGSSAFTSTDSDQSLSYTGTASAQVTPRSSRGPVNTLMDPTPFVVRDTVSSEDAGSPSILMDVPPLSLPTRKGDGKEMRGSVSMASGMAVDKAQGLKGVSSTLSDATAGVSPRSVCEQ
ncbi:hypothetical protein KIPB_000994 [Kipferlia bialata]|uniref:Uncharacterized protein n=1 Tax=Kipferlia bialata TaxID=797122 RepID=A0A9K3GFG1_9EUKA|nr:hypothetical protein KIPB_000994 [Kipferlia bialata]|eukprot:g994.t1